MNEYDNVGSEETTAWWVLLVDTALGVLAFIGFATIVVFLFSLD